MAVGQSTSKYILENQLKKDILNSSVLDMLPKKMLNHLKKYNVLQQPVNHYPYLKHLNLDHRPPDNGTPDYLMTIPEVNKNKK